MQIKDKVFYVTGGASGLGRATVEALVKEHAYVALLDLNEDEAGKIEKTYSEVVSFQKCDVRSEDDVLNAIKAIDKKWPRYQTGGLIHCGGIGMVSKTVERDGTPADLGVWREVIDINLTGTFNVARLVASRIVQAHPPPTKDSPVTEDRGVLIFTSSTSYQDGQMGQAAYATSKAGVAGLVLPMARDLGRYGIRVNAIAPSLFTTAMGTQTPEAVRANLLKAVEFPPRFGNADEFASLALEMLRNGYLNGTIVRLDAASRMGKL